MTVSIVKIIPPFDRSFLVLCPAGCRSTLLTSYKLVENNGLVPDYLHPSMWQVVLGYSTAETALVVFNVCVESIRFMFQKWHLNCREGLRICFTTMATRLKQCRGVL